MRVYAKRPAEQPVWEQCEDALAMCKSLDTALNGMQNRLSLGLPVNATMNIVEWDLHSLDVRIEDLRKAVDAIKEVE
jgi:hypothetical protein